MGLEITESIHGSSTSFYAAGSRNPGKEVETMMPMHDPDGLRRLERELRDRTESTRRVREARSHRPAPEEPPAATVTVLPELVPEMAEQVEEACATCDREREQTPA
jgi:hypothetical protein